MTPDQHGRDLSLQGVTVESAPKKIIVSLAWDGVHPLELDAHVEEVEGSATQMVQVHSTGVRVNLELDDSAAGRGRFKIVGTTHHQETRCAVERSFSFDASGAEVTVQPLAPSS
jgi:hypothetical protein